MILNRKHRAKEANECYSCRYGRIIKSQLERTHYLYEKIVKLICRTDPFIIFSLPEGIKKDCLNVMIEKYRELKKENKNLKNLIKSVNSAFVNSKFGFW